MSEPLPTTRIRDLYATALSWDMGDHHERPELARFRDERYAEFDRWLAGIGAQVAEEIGAVIEAGRCVCPTHDMPDCSPLLNGCSLPSIMTACYRDAARIAREHAKDAL